ncbi:hypothetical protein C8R43DRAFT_401361 [Mycena crocata]|nr:hypothetical protein C8R43DRAFT_401361 [Mycena crocata]
MLVATGKLFWRKGDVQLPKCDLSRNSMSSESSVAFKRHFITLYSPAHVTHRRRRPQNSHSSQFAVGEPTSAIWSSSYQNFPGFRPSPAARCHHFFTSSKLSQAGVEADDADPLSQINGHAPAIHLVDGAEASYPSKTSSAVYKIKRVSDHYHCSCPSWRNQARNIIARTCKHLLDLLGEYYEAARLKLKDPYGPPPLTPKRPTKSRRASAVAPETDGKDAEKSHSISLPPQLLLAKVWDLDGPDPTGWWISEKLYGVRNFYDGIQLLSRLGNPFMPPTEFMQQFPKDITLDGELYAGRGKLNSAVSIVKSSNCGDIEFDVRALIRRCLVNTFPSV